MRIIIYKCNKYLLNFFLNNPILIITIFRFQHPFDVKIINIKFYIFLYNNFTNA
jgi:hypothetical protein